VGDTFHVLLLQRNLRYHTERTKLCFNYLSNIDVSKWVLEDKQGHHSHQINLTDIGELENQYNFQFSKPGNLVPNVDGCLSNITDAYMCATSQAVLKWMFSRLVALPRLFNFKNYL